MAFIRKILLVQKMSPQAADSLQRLILMF